MRVLVTGAGGFIGSHVAELAVAAEFITRLELAPGAPVLDVACGTGNIAIPAARAGATVTGVDIATNLLEQARARAVAEGLAIQFDEGDAEQLPYGDATFDTVVSMFGAMFAPGPERVAAELTRVCRRGGRIAMANWTLSGFFGQMLQLTSAHVSPPEMPAPVLWGNEAVVRKRLREGISELRMMRRLVSLKFPFEVPKVVEFYHKYYGPTLRAFEVLSIEDQAVLRRDLERLWSEHNRAIDGTTYIESEYLEVVPTRG